MEFGGRGWEAKDGEWVWWVAAISNMDGVGGASFVYLRGGGLVSCADVWV